MYPDMLLDIGCNIEPILVQINRIGISAGTAFRLEVSNRSSRRCGYLRSRIWTKPFKKREPGASGNCGPIQKL